MSWHLNSYEVWWRDGESFTRNQAWAINDMSALPQGNYGYTLKHIRDIHRALLSLSDEDYAKVVELIEGEEELYE